MRCLLQKVCMNPKPQTALDTLQNILNFTIHDKCGPIQWATQMMTCLFFSLAVCNNREFYLSNTYDLNKYGWVVNNLVSYQGASPHVHAPEHTDVSFQKQDFSLLLQVI